MSRHAVATDQAPAAIGPYSQGIKANGFVFVSGQAGLVPGTKEFAGKTVAEQTAQTFKNISAILQAAGTDLAHIVKTTVFLVNMSDFAEMNGIYKTFFTGEPPARSTIAAKDLPLGALVEIEAIAVLPG
jgi:2-iminobutanoate/2-iminopropanoate deaminase